MYTSYIGKKLLQLYNEKHQTQLSAEAFFLEKVFELFFNDERHLMHVGNSPFFQPVSKEELANHDSKQLAQLHSLQTKIAEGVPYAGIYVGYAAKEIDGTTTGQVTSMPIKIDAEEMYASWIGEGLGIGVSGGFVMLLDQPEVLWTLYEGWAEYRLYLQQTPHVKDKQIETWNGHWLHYRLHSRYHPQIKMQVPIDQSKEVSNIPTIAWTKILFALAKFYGAKTLTAYCYNLSQMNTTLGFVNLYLPEVQKLYDIRNAVFIHKDDAAIQEEDIEKLLPFYSFKQACRLGTIGLKALEPDKLRTYMPTGSMPFAAGKDYKFSDKASYFNYELYKIWILAMLNKTELAASAESVAAALHAFEEKAERGKSDYARLSQEVREAKNLKTFLDTLTTVFEKTPPPSEFAEVFHTTAMQVLQMPTDHFPLFITLLRFKYQYQRHQNNQ